MFKDWNDVYHEPKLAVPIGGKVYEVEPMSMRTMLEIEAALDGGKPFGDGSNEQFYKATLGGSVFAAMVADDVPFEALKKASSTAWLDARFGRASAEAFWDAPVDEKPKPAKRATAKRG